MSGATRRAKRQATRARSRKREYQGPCAHSDCEANAYSKASCITCEELGAQKPAGYAFCLAHQDWAIAKIKKHALVKHPVNIVRAVAAGLRGEDVS